MALAEFEESPQKHIDIKILKPSLYWEFRWNNLTQYLIANSQYFTYSNLPQVSAT